MRPPAGRARAGAWALLATLVAAVALGGCGGGGAIRASAVFGDVSNLAVGAPVEMADIRVGSVRSISLSGTEARVDMSIQRSARVPATVSASIQTTTILGERIVELDPGPGVSASSPLLADGARIRRTVVVPDLEALVKGGAQLFSPISASALASLVEAGGQGFGDQGADIHRLLVDLSAVSAGYAGQTTQIQALVHSLDQLGRAAAPDAQANAEAVSNLARTTQILAEQSKRFDDLLQALDGLSVQGRSMMESYLAQIGVQLTALADATGAVAGEQADLARVLVYLKGHNRTISAVTLGRLVQILDDVIVCGAPGGGSNNTAVSTCAGAGGSP